MTDHCFETLTASAAYVVLAVTLGTVPRADLASKPPVDLKSTAFRSSLAHSLTVAAGFPATQYFLL